MTSDTETGETANESPVSTSFLVRESGTFSDVPTKKGRGRPRKDGAPVGSRSALPPKAKRNGEHDVKEAVTAPDVPGARFRVFYSDHDNPNQKTRALWTWWNQLPGPMKQIIEAHVYREWPVILDPPEDWCSTCKLLMSPELGKCPRCGEQLRAQEYKYIDKIIGVEPVQNDQDFIDKYGAGDYHIYLNVNPAAGPRRTLTEAWIKGTHDFRKYPPGDKRIQNVANLSLSDPLNASYVAWLRSQSKIPDEEKQKEREDMAASGVLVDKLIDRVDKLTDRVIENAERGEAPSAPVETPQQQTLGMFEIIERIQKLTEGRNGNSPDVGAIMQSAIAMAQAISKANDPSAYLQKISDLEAQVRKQEAEARQKVLDEIREEVRSLKANPGTAGATAVIPTKSLGEQLKEARDLFRELEFGDDGAPTKAAPWWAAPLIEKGVMEKGLELVGAIATRLLTPSQPANPPTNSVPAFPGPVQQQLPPQPPHVQQQPPQAPPSQPQVTPEQLEVQRILVLIAAQVIEALSAEDGGGDDFAAWFREEIGLQSYRFFSKYEVDQIVGTLYQFPLIAPRIGQFPQDKVRQFIEEFKAFDADEYEAKMDAREKGGAA